MAFLQMYISNDQTKILRQTNEKIVASAFDGMALFVLGLAMIASTQPNARNFIRRK